MAELTLTEEEKHTAYMHWDDAALGRAVKKVALDIRDLKGDDALLVTSCASVLAARAAARKAAAIVIPLLALADGPENHGNWKITVWRIPEFGGENRRRPERSEHEL